MDVLPFGTPLSDRIPAPTAGSEETIDIGLLNDDIDRLCRAHKGAAGNQRKAVVERLRSALETGRDKARASLEAGGKGLDCAARLSRLEDDIIRAIYRYVTSHVYPAENPSSAERLAVLAVGGYGRATLAPGSDIDLLFLLPYKQTAWGESVVEAMLYVLWDLKQKIGHATRSIDECLRQAKQDITIRTSVLEARLILGDEKLFDLLRSRFDKEIVRFTAREFVIAKLAERDVRVQKAGNSRYLVEPNVKESKGGLRDLNTLFWIAKYVYRVREISELVEAGLFTPRELQLFLRCEEFLWRVRCHLHFATGRAEDRLSFDVQRAISARLGYVARDGMSDVERFMKHYFLMAKNVGNLTAIVCAALEENQTKPQATLNRFIGKLRRKKPVIMEPGFAEEFGRVTVVDDGVFDRDPANLLRLFWLASERQLAIHPDATRLVTRSLKKIDVAARADPLANLLFLDILTSRQQPEVVLRCMNEAGVLAKFIPVFGKIVGMMQFNMYHQYTVDEHLLCAVGILSDIESGRLKDEHPLCFELLASIAGRRCLYVAMFLHDVAKGRKEDHSIAGARDARAICPRLGLSEAETETVAWLIEYHLVMSDTAQSRDLADPRTIQAFASKVQTLERLRLLLVLTACDIRAVGPGVWNGWKGQLLRTLYFETEVMLAGGHSTINRDARVAASKRELRGALTAWTDAEFDAYAARHYPAYWLRVDLPHKAAHARMLRGLDAGGEPLTTEVATDSFQAITELTVVAQDHPRLLSIVAGACAAAGANIMDAQIFTTTDGLALDTISIKRGFDHDEDELRRAGRVADTIEKTLRGELRLDDAVAARSRTGVAATSAFTIAPEALIDNTLSVRSTVLQVSGLDRPGLLFDLTQALSDLNLNIASAHIATFGEKAVDVFYVVDLTGAKITSPARHDAVRLRMLDVFGEGHSVQSAKAKRVKAS